MKVALLIATLIYHLPSIQCLIPDDRNLLRNFGARCHNPYLISVHLLLHLASGTGVPEKGQLFNMLSGV